MKNKNILGIKPAWDIATLTALMAVTILIGASYNDHRIQVTTAQASEKLEIVKAAMAPVQELNQENSELRSLLSKDSGGKVVIVNDGSAKSKALFKARKEWGDSQLASFERLVNSESGFRPDAQNKTSTAYGMFQFLDSTWKSYNCEKTEEIDHQIDCGIRYIKQRYGTPNEAWRMWLERSPHWY